MRIGAFACTGLIALLASCAGHVPAPIEDSATTAANRDQAATPPRVASTKPDPVQPPDGKALQAKLLSMPVSGYVLFDRRARLEPTADAARAATALPWTAHVAWGALQVIADEGDVVRVTTETLRRDRRSRPIPATIDTSFVIEAFIAKRMLVPVLSRSLTRAFDDGTGYALERGLPLVLLERPRVLENVSLPAAIDDGGVALSFEPEETPLRLDRMAHATELGCKRGAPTEAGDETTRVDVLSALADARTDGSDFGHGLGARGVSASCSLHGSGGALGGVALATRDPCDSVERTVRAADGRVFVEYRSGHASVRALVSDRELRAGGGCGTGRMGPKRRAVIRAKTKTAVWFPDGTRAGSVDATREITVSNTSEANGRPCTTRSYLSVPICFDPADVVREQGFAFSDER